MADLEVGDLRLVAGVGQDFEAHLDELVHATHEHVLLAEEIGLGLFLEGGLDGTGAQGTEGLGVGQGQSPAVATRILLDGHDDRHATASGVLTTNDVARALRGNHEHRVILRRLDVAVVDVETVGEGQGSARLQIRLNVLLVDGCLVLVRQKNHHNVSLGNGLANRLDLKALLLGELHGLGGRTQADDHVDTGVTQVQRMGVALGTVTDDGNLLAIENREITVVLIPDLCCHYWHSFSVVGCGAAGRRGYLRCADKSCFARIVSFKPSSILPRTPSQPRWSPQRELGHYWSMDSRVQRTILDNNSAPF